MPIVEIHAKRPRSRALLAEIPAVVATALGCALRDVRVYIIDVDACAAGDDSACGSFVILRAEPRDDAAIAKALEATARAVAATQGEPVEDVWVDWVDAPLARVFGGTLR